MLLYGTLYQLEQSLSILPWIPPDTTRSCLGGNPFGSALRAASYPTRCISELSKDQRFQGGKKKLLNDLKAEMGQIDPKHNRRVKECWLLATCYRPECISLGYCHIPWQSLANRICGQPHIRFYCGRVCYSVTMPMKWLISSMLRTVVCVCVRERCLVLCCALCKGHMFDRLLDLDHRRLRVADTDQNSVK